MKADTYVMEHVFRAFLRVQKSGEFNMVSPSARAAVGTTKDEHTAILKGYDELCKKYSDTYSQVMGVEQ